ncbi:UNVERIFIED_CONTAM: hypothetical protein GTU68_047023 [Idotea baltica]|nr:hypothetical protein [Idotea baltica]
MIIDPGCYEDSEKEMLQSAIIEQGLKPEVLFNTHCHIDHVLGNRFVAELYQLELTMHRGEIPVLDAVQNYGAAMGLTVDPSPAPKHFVEEGDIVKFGNSELEVLFTPGHSPASVSLLDRQAKILIAGDVLFQNSIGRTDLPGGDFDTLITSIREKFFVLDDDILVYPGHGPSTTIGHEKVNNPFLNGSYKM